MKIKIMIALTVLGLASLACTINIPLETVDVGETQTLQIAEEKLPGEGPFRLAISMGAGSLAVQPGAQNWVEGNVLYNVSQFKPVVERSTDSLKITQDVQWDNKIPTNLDDVVNTWDLKLGNVPTALTINAGAYNGVLDFSGVPLSSLTINDGASNATVKFGQPNPEQMDLFTYRTGASNVNLEGLANANFAAMTFIGGAGTYKLDFSGEMTRTASVRIEGGVSNYKIIIPSGTACEVILEGSLNNVSTQGNWTSRENGYSLEGSTPTLTITLNLGVGSLELIEE